MSRKVKVSEITSKKKVIRELSDEERESEGHAAEESSASREEDVSTSSSLPEMRLRPKESAGVGQQGVSSVRLEGGDEASSRDVYQPRDESSGRPYVSSRDEGASTSSRRQIPRAQEPIFQDSGLQLHHSPIAGRTEGIEDRKYAESARKKKSVGPWE